MTWWRRNKVAVLLLPALLVLTTAATSSRVVEYWLETGPHHALPAEAGTPYAYSGSYVDALGEHPRELTVVISEPVRDTQLRRIPGLEPEEVPTWPQNSTVWRVDLTWTVDPQLPLGGCMLSLVGTDGSETTYRTGTLGVVGAPFDVCEPVGFTGSVPTGVFDLDEPPQEPSTRPQTYTVPAYFVTADDVVPAEVRLWWTFPDYVSVPVDVPVDATG